MDLADWEYVVNLSAFDVPLRKGREVWRVLDLPQNRGNIYMAHWGDFEEMSVRFVRPHILRTDPSPPEFINYHPPEAGLMFPPFLHWKVCRQHQWMILPRDFVQHLRDSDEAVTALAFVEHTRVPDESYFCYVALNTPRFAPQVVADNKRYVTFYRMHARTLEYENRNELEVPGLYDPPRYDLPSVGEPPSSPGSGIAAVSSEKDTPRYLFVRKIDVRHPTGIALARWIQETHSERFLGKAKGFYGLLGGEEWAGEPHTEIEAEEVVEGKGSQGPGNADARVQEMEVTPPQPPEVPKRVSPPAAAAPPPPPDLPNRAPP
ncbi:hypothetical protein HDU96_005272, partial [Phlyctochytrium bullatum]